MSQHVVVKHDRELTAIDPRTGRDYVFIGNDIEYIFDANVESERDTWDYPGYTSYEVYNVKVLNMDVLVDAEELDQLGIPLDLSEIIASDVPIFSGATLTQIKPRPEHIQAAIKAFDDRDDDVKEEVLSGPDDLDGYDPHDPRI